jgi:hypothetical protein
MFLFFSTNFRLDVSSMPRMPPHSAKVLKPCLIFSNFEGDNCQKSFDRNFNLIKVRKWKLKISYFFVISRGITLSKSKEHNQIRTWPAHSYDVSTCAISTLYMNPNKSSESGNWKFHIFFQSSRGITLSKSMNHYQIRIWAAYFYDVFTHAISTLYIHPN